MNNQEEGRDTGFSLIELLIVIAILGILAVVVVLSVGGTETNAKKKACTADYKTMQVAAEAYNASTGKYPAANADLLAAPAYLQADSDSYTVSTVSGGALSIGVKVAPANVNGCTSPPTP